MHRSGVVALQVVQSQGATLAIAEVTLAGQGPYPFIVDTGSSTSVVDTKVAKAAGLEMKGKQSKVSGVGCTTKARRAKVTTWSAGGVTLPGDQVSVLSLAKGANFGGLLGSDVLSRFGEVAVDYTAQQLDLGGSAVHLSGTSTTRVPIKVVDHHGAVLAVAPVHVRHKGPYPFVVDTGAATSVVGKHLAHQLHLKVVARHVKASGVSCHVTSSQVHVPRWQVGPVTLPATTAMSTLLPGTSGGIDGLLGSNMLSRFGTVAIAYGRQRLILASQKKVPAGGTVTLSIHQHGGETSALAPVKIDGKGPFGFTVDTGASRSVVARAVVHRLGLSTSGHASTSWVVSKTKAPVVTLSTRSAGKVTLPHATAVAVRLGSSSGGMSGLLGSDVLDHFGTVAVHYRSGQLVLPGS